MSAPQFMVDNVVPICPAIGMSKTGDFKTDIHSVWSTASDMCPTI